MRELPSPAHSDPDLFRKWLNLGRSVLSDVQEGSTITEAPFFSHDDLPASTRQKKVHLYQKQVSMSSLALLSSAIDMSSNPQKSSGGGGTYSSFAVNLNAPNSVTSTSSFPQVKAEAGTDEIKSAAPSAQVCTNCGTSKTPLWRRAPDGSTICNACGLYLKARNAQRPVKKQKTTPTKAESPVASHQHTLDAAAHSCAGTCPGDGHCNGTGGSSACSGCPAFNNRLAKQATAVTTSNSHSTDGAAMSPTPNQESQSGEDLTNIACQNCGTTITPLWRRDDAGNTICNACGLYYRMHGHHRPMGMKKSTIKRRKRIINGSGTPQQNSVQFTTISLDNNNNTTTTTSSSSPAASPEVITLPPIAAARSQQHQQKLPPGPAAAQPAMSSSSDTNRHSASPPETSKWAPLPVDFTQSYKSQPAKATTTANTTTAESATKLPSIHALTDYTPTSDDNLKISSILNKSSDTVPHKNARTLSSSSSSSDSTSQQQTAKRPKIDIPDYLAGANVRDYLLEKRKKAEEKLAKQRQKMLEAELYLKACDDALNDHRS